MTIDNDPYINDQRYNRLECFADLMLQPFLREKPEVQFNREKFSLLPSISSILGLLSYMRGHQRQCIS